MDKKVIVFGTRPEFIKLLPVILEIRRQRLDDQYCSVYTGQHTDLVQDLFGLFEFQPTYTVRGHDPVHSLSHSFSHILSGLQEVLKDIQKQFSVQIVIGQGDTTSCACAALCAFLNQIPFAHIEAGLRTFDLENPFPEEYFRLMISLATEVHFAPTVHAQKNLLHEGIPAEKILVTGNTIVDAVDIIRQRMPDQVPENSPIHRFCSGELVLITCHRRENQNERFDELTEVVKTLAAEHRSLQFLWISHAAPFVKCRLSSALFKNFDNIQILPPVNIFELYRLYEHTRIIITDSGGMQEEAPGFQIPVIVIREQTERTESLDLGYAELTGIHSEKLIGAFRQLIGRQSVPMTNPYGSGQAAGRIVTHLQASVRFH